MRVSPFIHLVVPAGTLTYYGHCAPLVWADVPGQWPIFQKPKISAGWAQAYTDLPALKYDG